MKINAQNLRIAQPWGGLFLWPIRLVLAMGLFFLPLISDPVAEFFTGSTIRADSGPVVTVKRADKALVDFGYGLVKPDLSASGKDAGRDIILVKPEDKGGGNGGGGGGGKPDDPGGGGGKPDTPGRGQGDLYADLVLKYRSLHGLEIFVGVPAGFEEEAPDEAVVGEYVDCQQPITAVAIEDGLIDTYAKNLSPPLTNPMINPADGKSVSPVPLGGTGAAGEECDVQSEPDDFTAFTKEVQFGRLNIGRSPDTVLDEQLKDVLDTLSNSSNNLGWDSAGRIMSGEYTVDSPLQNLAIHRELLVYGDLIEQAKDSVDLPALPWTSGLHDYLDYAAAALGAAADKGSYFIEGTVNLDLVVYNNRILDIPNRTKIEGINDVIEGNGDVGVKSRYYYDFSVYSYTRELKYPGCFTGLTLAGEAVQGTIMSYVFGDENLTRTNVYGFATAADDTRRVIAFEHDDEGIIVLKVDKAGMSDLCN